MKKVNLTTATLAILAGVLTAPTITNAENSTETGTTIDAVEQVTTEAEEVEGEEASEEATQTGTTIASVEQVTTEASEETSEEATQDRGIVEDALLFKAKKDAIEEINGMSELTDWEKAGYIAKITLSGSVDDVKETLTDARNENQKRLDIKEAKKNAEYTISQLYHDGKLSEDEAFEFLEEARNATDVEGVDAAVAKAEAKAAENVANAEAEKALAEAKLKAEYAISQLYYDGKLSEDETFEFLEEARNAKDVAGVEAAIKKAEDKAAENVANAEAEKALAAAKEKAKAELKAALDEALKTTLLGRMTNSEKQDKLISIYEDAIKAIDDATSQKGIDDAVDWALEEFEKISSEQVDEVTNADDYVNSIYGGDLLKEDQKAELDNQIKEANSIQELEAIKIHAFNQGRENAIEFAQRQLDAGNINQGDFDFYESKYNELKYTGNMSDADAITAITAMMLDLIEARQAAENTLALYLADGWITIDQYNKFIERINEVHTAEEVLKLMDLIAMAPDNERPIDPMDPDNERPVDPTPPGDDNDGSTGDNNDGSTGGSNSGSTGGSNSGSTGGSNSGSTGGSNSGSTGGNNGGSTGGNNGGSTGGTASTGTASKGSAGQLPATGEEVRNGLIAGGLASVLGGAALFFRKPR